MRLLQCDSCGKQEKCGRGHYDEGYTFVHVDANEDSDHASLCSWDCLATWAMSKVMEKREASDV